jgi:hypothetical protein
VNNTQIDLTKMSEQSRLYYLQDLIEDLADCIKDLDKERIRYDYISHTVSHAHQAIRQISKLLK